MTKIIPLITLFIIPVLLAGCDRSDPELKHRARCTELRQEAIHGVRGEITKKAYEKAKNEWIAQTCKRSDAIPPQSPLARENKDSINEK